MSYQFNVNLNVLGVVSVCSVWFGVMVVQELLVQESLSKLSIVNIKVIL